VRDISDMPTPAEERRRYAIPYNWGWLGGMAAGTGLCVLLGLTGEPAWLIGVLPFGAFFALVLWRDPLWIVLDDGMLVFGRARRAEPRKVADLVSILWTPRTGRAESAVPEGLRFTFREDVLWTNMPRRATELVECIQSLNPSVRAEGFGDDVDLPGW
jgi:hypothetical protein